MRSIFFIILIAFFVSGCAARVNNKFAQSSGPAPRLIAGLQFEESGDNISAIDHYYYSAKYNNPIAMVKLAQAYYSGDYIDKNDELALYWSALAYMMTDCMKIIYSSEVSVPYHLASIRIFHDSIINLTSEEIVEVKNKVQSVLEDNDLVCYKWSESKQFNDFRTNDYSWGALLNAVPSGRIYYSGSKQVDGATYVSVNAMYHFMKAIKGN